MNYDRNKAVVELEKLYHDDRKLADNFIHTFEENRGVFTEYNELARLAFLPYEREVRRLVYHPKYKPKPTSMSKPSKTLPSNDLTIF